MKAIQVIRNKQKTLALRLDFDWTHPKAQSVLNVAQKKAGSYNNWSLAAKSSKLAKTKQFLFEQNSFASILF